MNNHTPQSVTYAVGDADVRPWGTWSVIASGDGYICKEITVQPGQTLSLQNHQHRSEHWIILSGIADVTLGDEVLRMERDQTVFIPKTVKHRIANPGDDPLRFVEVQVGQILDENDIERFEDRYGRSC